MVSGFFWVACGFFAGYVFAKAQLRTKPTAAPRRKLNTKNRETKMVLVVRKDLGMNKGKIAAQCAHAALACYETCLQADPEVLNSWKHQGQAKVTLQCESLEDIHTLELIAKSQGIVAEHIVDAGRTQIAAGSVTVLGIGPGPVDLINTVTGNLKLL